LFASVGAAFIIGGSIIISNVISKRTDVIKLEAKLSTAATASSSSSSSSSFIS